MQNAWRRLILHASCGGDGIISTAQGYSDSKGLFSARKAVMQYYQQKQVEGVGIEDIYLGNGVSELVAN